MKRSSTALAALAVALVTALGAGAGNGTPINNGSANRLDLAVIGDLPYNAAGFTDILARIEARSAAFDGPVLLLQGDSHQFVADKPFAGAQNITRIVVEGSATGDEWLKLSVDPRSSAFFSWERIPF